MILLRCLVICLEHHRLDMKHIATRIRAGRLSFGRAELHPEPGKRGGELDKTRLVRRRQQRPPDPDRAVFHRNLRDADFPSGAHCARWRAPAGAASSPGGKEGRIRACHP